MNQRKIWLNELEICQLSWEEHRKEKLFKISTGRVSQLGVSAVSVVRWCWVCSWVHTIQWRSAETVRAENEKGPEDERKLPELVWDQAEQFSEKLREARLSQLAWRGVWAGKVKLDQQGRVQKEIERVSLFSSEPMQWQLHLVNKLILQISPLFIINFFFHHS